MTPETWCPPSGSKLAVGEKCPASLALPRVASESGMAAEIGTGIHDFIEAVASAMADGVPSMAEGSSDPDVAVGEAARAVALAAIPASAPWRERCEALDVAALELRTDSLHEVGFRLHVAEGRVEFLGTGLKHGDAKGAPGTIVGVFDRVTDRPELDLVEVDDWKTGFLPVPVKDNAQLLLGAVCAAKHFGRSRVQVRIVKLPEDGRPRPESATLDALDLDLGLLRLAAIVDSGREQVRRSCAGEPLSYVEGEGCRYCPSFVFCAAAQRSLVTLAREPLNIEAALTGAIETCTDEEAATAFEKFKAWDAIAKRVRVAFVMRARTRPIPFPDGTVYGERSYTKTTLDGERTFEVVAEAYGRDEAAACVKKKATKKGIGVAAKMITEARKKGPAVPKGTPKPTIKATTAEIMNLLETKCAAVEETKRKLDRHKPGEAASDDDDE